MSTRVRVLVVALVSLAASLACAATNSVGLYSSDQYSQQVKQVANAQATITADEAKISGLNTDVQRLQGLNQSLESQVTALTVSRDQAKGDLSKYERIVCTKHTWADLNDVGVWFLSSNDSYLQSVEKDTQVSFYLTKWNPLGQDTSSIGATILVIDYYNGVALNSTDGCVILDPAKWPIGR